MYAIFKYKQIKPSPILFYKPKSNPKLKDNKNVKPDTCIWSVCLIFQRGNHGEKVYGSSLQSPLTRAPPYQKFWKHRCLKLHLLHHRTASSLVCTPWTPSFIQSFACAWKPQTPTDDNPEKAWMTYERFFSDHLQEDADSSKSP